MAAYDDDPSITADEFIWRRIHPTQYVWDENLQRDRPSSGAFRDSTDDGTPMSAARERLAGDPYNYCTRWGGVCYLARFKAEVPRSYGQKIASEPPVQGEPEHLYVVGKKTGRVKDALAAIAEWAVRPPTKKPT